MWCLLERVKSNSIDLQFIQPGKPTQNAYIERFNRSYRAEVLDCGVFEALVEVKRMIEEWNIPPTMNDRLHQFSLLWQNHIYLYFRIDRKFEVVTV